MTSSGALRWAIVVSAAAHATHITDNVHYVILRARLLPAAAEREDYPTMAIPEIGMGTWTEAGVGRWVWTIFVRGWAPFSTAPRRE